MRKLFNWFLAEGFVVNDDYDREIRASRSVVAIRVKKLYNGYWVIIRQVENDGSGTVSEFMCKTVEDVTCGLINRCVVYQS